MDTVWSLTEEPHVSSVKRFTINQNYSLHERGDKVGKHKPWLR